MFTREGDVRPIGFTQQTLAPIPTSAALATLSVFSLIQGNAVQDISEEDFIKAAQDEFGTEITRSNWPAIGSVIANRLFLNVPLSPMMMSMQARPATAYPGNFVERDKKYPALPADRVDVATLFGMVWDAFASPEKSTWDATQFAKLFGRFTLKAFTGIQSRDIPSVGPIESARLQRLFEQLDRQFKDDFDAQQKRAQANVAAAFYDAQNGTNTFDSLK
jgi:hypothetical protein